MITGPFLHERSGRVLINLSLCRQNNPRPLINNPALCYIITKMKSSTTMKKYILALKTSRSASSGESTHGGTSTETSLEL